MAATKPKARKPKATTPKAAVVDMEAMAALASIVGGTLGAYTRPLPHTSIALLAAYSRIPQLRAPFARMASGMNAPVWRLFGYQPEPGAAFQRHHRLQRLTHAQREREIQLAGPTLVPWELARPGARHDFYDLIRGSGPLTGVLMQVTDLHRELAGEAFWYLQRNGLRRPAAAWPIPPHWVTQKPTLDGQSPFYRVQFNGATIEIPESEVLAFPDPDPVNPYGRGAGAGMALGDESNTASALSKHLGAFFENHAVPPMVIMPDSQLGGTDGKGRLQQLEDRWIAKTQGRERRGIPYFSNIKLLLKELSGTFNEMQVAELLKLNWNICRMTLCEPPEVLGNVENANRSTVGAAYDLHSRLNLVPRLDFFQCVMQVGLIERWYDPRLILLYDSPVDHDNEFTLRLIGYVPEAFSVNELRQLGHQDLLSNAAGGNLHIVRKGISFAPLRETVAETPAVASSGNGHDHATAAAMAEGDPMSKWQRQSLHRYIELLPDETLPDVAARFTAEGHA